MAASIKKHSVHLASTVLLCCSFLGSVHCQTPLFTRENENISNRQWSELVAHKMLAIHPYYVSYDTPSLAWNYEQGVILMALWRVWENTSEQKYFDYVKKSIDFYLAEDDTIKTYDQEAFRLDDILLGRVILKLYQATGDVRYRNAAMVLRDQLYKQPRTKEGGFWHKKIYPNQMWLDGLYMAGPFYAEFATMFEEPKDFDDITKQFILMAKHARDPKTGLFYHGWDETETQKWADPKTGDSPTFWGRSMGWYMMGLVDVLDYLPKNHPDRPELISIFRGLSSALLKYQDEKTHLWYQVVNKPDEESNYLESSASAMFAYSFAKGAHKGYLSKKYLNAAKAAFRGLIRNEIRFDKNDLSILMNTCAGAGLGGIPYRDGTYKYYVSLPKVEDDFKGVGPFIVAALELEKDDLIGRNKIVGLDCYFNNEWKRTGNGKEIRYHYIWEDTENTGYSQLGEIIKKLGAQLDEVETAPTVARLDKLSIYIIVDPDTPSENPHPNYIDDNSIAAIVNWVKNGGVLVLFGNDKGNCEFAHLNKLAGYFGIHFNEDSRNDVVGKNYGEGAFTNLPDIRMFKGVKKIFLKEISTLRIHEPAKAELVDKGDIIMATSHFGKGFVFAVGDPWFYNEYIDNRKLPDEFDNFEAARSLFEWLLAKARQTAAE